MTTLTLPVHTFVTADDADFHDNPNMDVINFDRPFFKETLSPRTLVVTRVNPKIPSIFRWAVRNHLRIGIQNVFVQWCLLALQGLTPLVVFGWIAGRLRGKAKTGTKAAADHARRHLNENALGKSFTRTHV